MNNRMAVIAIWVASKEHVDRLNAILSDFSEFVRGRMGLPCRERQGALISLIVEGNTDQIGALSGKLGMVEGLTVKSVFMTN